jgi:hypothetical protein
MIPFGKALDARKNRPILPANPIYSAPPLTVECFARLDSAKGFNILVANEPKSSATHWELYTYAGTGELCAYMPGYSPSEIRSNAIVTDGKWHYCAMTFDGRRVRLYVDGKPVKAESVLRRAGMGAVAGPLGVGDVPGDGIGCDGLIDEVRVSSVIRAIGAVPTAPFEDDAETLALWHFDPAFAGTGLSALTDPFRAGAEAALRARKALGSGEARAVIVFDNLPGDEAAHKALIEGIGWFFDPATVFGCTGFGPITRDGATGTVGVLALGEAFTVASACATVAGDHEACGSSLGQALKGDLAKAATGRVVILLGDCHVPANDALVRGFLRGAGANVPTVGGSCPQNGLVYDKGVPKRSANIALMLTGEFRVGLALQAAHAPDQIAASAREAAARAARTESGGPGLLLVFDCVSRLQALGAHAATELEAIRSAVGSAPLFGFYGSGEIGAETVGAQPRGVGAHVTMCALIR